jgi:glycosyltransferase involved in cell wall biosynthesis
MRILFFSSIFPQPHDHRRGIFCLQLCKALADSHEVQVISPSSWVERLRYRKHSMVLGDAKSCAHLQGLEVRYPWYYYPPKMLRSAYGWFMWASVAGELRKSLSKFEPDCVLSYWSYPDGAVATRAARIAGVPSVVMVGGSDVLLCDESGMRAPVAAALRSANAVVTIGRDLRDKVVALGVPADRVHITQRGVDSQRFCPGDRQEARKRLGIPTDFPTVLWVGRMVPVKGLTVLLETCARLRATGQRVRFYLVGDGPMRSTLERAALAAGLLVSPTEGNAAPCGVTFVGSREHDQLPDWFRAADVTVLPSLSEGVPNVLRESLACGTPFVASKVGGIPEISADPVNRLVPPGDAAALANALSLALAERPGRRVAAPVLSWNQAAESLLEVIRRL